MAGDKLLVLGGTGPAGICLLRELIHRKHPTVVYARNPAKVPQDLASNPSIEIIQGDLTQREALSTAVSQSRLIISLLGPSTTRQPNTSIYADCYRILIPLMKEHGVRRLLAMGTLSIYQPEDRSSIIRFLFVRIVKIAAPGAYHNIIAIQHLFEEEETVSGIDWTVFRIGNLGGSSNAEAWDAERAKGLVYAGPLGAPGWTSLVNRSVLARWLVDEAESTTSEWIGRMPAVSRLAS